MTTMLMSNVMPTWKSDPPVGYRNLTLVALKLDSSGTRAVLWEEGEITDLGSLGEDEDSSRHALAINDSSQIVGLEGAGGDTSKAVLWNDGDIYNLNDLIENDFGIRLKRAVDINNHGQIVGGGYIGDGDDFHAFLLTPVPEPASLVSALIGVGAIGLIAAARRRRRQG